MSHASSLGRLESEISTQTRLANLYQQSRDESRAEVAALQAAREQMQQAMTSALARQEASEQEAQQTIDRLTSELGVRDQTIADLTRANADVTQQLQLLREEIDAAQQANGGSFTLVPSIGGDARTALALAPSSSQPAASASDFGHAELYGKYLQALDQLRQEKHESKLLEQYLQQIQREISEKAPLIEQQRFAYNKLLSLNTTLSEKVQHMQSDQTALKEECEQMRGARATAESSLARAQQECDDLARQVRSLLRGKSQISSDRGDLSSHDLISESLVEVVDIDDVQSQNQRLMTVVRDLAKQNEELTAKKDASDRADEVARQEQQSAQLTEAYQLVDTLKEQRKGLEIRLEALLHGISLNTSVDGGETRMVLLDPQSIATAKVGGLYGSSSATAGLVADMQQQMRDQTASFDHRKEDWERERRDLTQQLSDLQAQSELVKKEQSLTMRHQTQQIDTMRDQFSAARIQVATLQSESKSFQSLYSELKTRHSESTREVDTLRARADQLNTQLIASQKQVQTIELDRTQIAAEKQKLAVEKVSLESAAAIATKSAARAAQENGDLQSHLTHLQSLVTSLQTMQTVFESRETSSRDSLVKEKESLRVDWLHCKQQLDEERRSAREMERHHQQQAEEMRAKINAAQAEYHTAKEQLVESKTLLAAAQQRITQLETDLTSSKASLDAIHASRAREQSDREALLADPEAGTPLQQAEMSLQKAQREVATHLETIAEQKGHLDHLTQISQQTERELQSLTLDSRLYKLKSEKELADLRETKSSLTARIEKLAADLKANELENAAQIDSLHQANRALETQLQATESQRKQSEQISSEYVGNLARLQSEVESHSQAARANQSKYEHELTNHANTIHQLNTKREESAAAAHAMAELRDEHARLQLDLQEATETSTRLQAAASEEARAHETKVAELKKQTDLLYGQIDVLTIQIKRVEENQNIEAMLAAPTNEGAAASATEDESAGAAASSSKQLSDLRDIVKFLRREKEELMVQHERLLQLHARTEHQATQLKQELRESQDHLQEEIRRAASAAGGAASSGSSVAATASEHDRLLAQLNQLHLLQESNSMLREENNKHVSRSRELQATIDRLESSVHPLTKRIDELAAANSALESDLAAIRIENSRWSGRYQKLLTQSDFVDPEIFKQLKEDHQQLQAVAAESQKQVEAAQQEKQQVDADREQMQTRFEKMKKAATHWYEYDMEHNITPAHRTCSSCELWPNGRWRLCALLTAVAFPVLLHALFAPVWLVVFRKERFELVSKDVESLQSQLADLQRQSAADQQSSAALNEITQAKNQGQTRASRGWRRVKAEDG